MTRERKTLDVVGVIKFAYLKKPDDLASIVEGCVRQWSMGDLYITEYVVLRNVRVVEVACRKGVASVVFKARAYRGVTDAVGEGVRGEAVAVGGGGLPHECPASCQPSAPALRGSRYDTTACTGWCGRSAPPDV
jgi:hypothetical protein